MKNEILLVPLIFQSGATKRRCRNIVISIGMAQMSTVTSHTVYRIRPSVDALCRDGADVISCDLRTKSLKTQQERHPRPSQYTSNTFRVISSLLLLPSSSSSSSFSSSSCCWGIDVTSLNPLSFHRNYDSTSRCKAGEERLLDIHAHLRHLWRR